jgi:hypothetical protein
MTMLLLVAVMLAQASGKPDSGRAQKLLELHEADARSYKVFRDESHQQPLELRREPIYRWTNPTRSGGQEGDVFLWTYKGRPEAIGCMFSHPKEGDLRVVCHELHSLSEVVLVVDRPAQTLWTPKAPGVDPKPVPDSPKPAATPAARVRQMQAMARDFAPTSEDQAGKTWELRLLTKPLYRYESTDPAVIDGALFGFVTSAGTDLELLLLIEARALDGGGTRWTYSVARFSDLALKLRHKGSEVWSVPLGPFAQQGGDEKQRYRLYADRIIDEILPKTGP